jgi:uncharacterized protein (UPF0332 family)
MDPRAFRDLATQLVVSKGANAASFRTAISRAYYASFHVASQTIENLGFPPPKGANAHKQVAQLLQESGENELQSLGGMLGDLHTTRLLADYRLDRSDVETRRSGQSAVETCIQIVDGLEQFMADAARKSAAHAHILPHYSLITGKGPVDLSS